MLVVARAQDPATGRSVLAASRTTCLPKTMERSAYWLTAPRHGRYVSARWPGDADLFARRLAELLGPAG